MQEINNLQPETSAATKKYITIFAVIVLFILSLVILSNSMSKTIGRDEQMYCTGGYLMAQGKMIYRDFSYISQMPYHPLLFAIVYKLTGTQHYLLAGRLISTICDILVIICILGIYRYAFKSSIVTGTLLGLAGATIYIFNPLVDYANGYAWNHDVVIFCVMLSLLIFITTDFNKRSALWRTATIGAILTFASCMRITTFLVEFVFFILLLCAPADSFKQRIKTTLPFIAASLIMLIWPVWIILNAPKAFYLNLFKIPALNGQWIHNADMANNKLELTIESLTKPGYFSVMLLTIFLFAMIIVFKNNFKIPNKTKIILASLLPLLFFLVAFIPLTMWQQYWAVPVPFIIASLAFPFSYFKNHSTVPSISKCYKVSITLLCICVIISVAAYPRALSRIILITVPETWTPIKLHRMSKNIASEMAQPRLVLTMAPIYAIEGNCDIYTELSCGPFVYRIVDSLSAEERQIMHAGKSKDITELIAAKPPSAIITKVEIEIFEDPILNAIDKSRWRIKEYENGPTIYYSQ